MHAMSTESRVPVAPSAQGAASSWGLGDGQAIPWEYAPAPESRDIVTLKERYGLFIGGREVPASDGGTFATIDPATEQPLAHVAKATAADVDKAVRVRASRRSRSWGDLPGRERAKYLFRIARILQERSREFAVLESMDSGKPIKESRDVDVPLAAAHFWYYAGWADKLEYAFPGRTAQPLGVAAQIIPWNFPLLMLAWKIAPALAAGQHGRPQAGLDDAADRPPLRRRLPPGGPAARRRQHRPGPGRDRDGARDPPGRRQGRLHRLDRDRQAHRQGRRRARTRP